MTNKFNGEVAFPPLEGKAVLRFTLGNLAGLEAEFEGEYKAALGGDVGFGQKAFHIWLIEQIAASAPKVTMAALRVGLKEPGGKKPCLAFDPMDPGFPIREAVVPLMDAINLSANGETFSEAMERIAKADAERQAAEGEAAMAAEEPPADPLTSPES